MINEREQDALDKMRTETGMYLRRYSRRVKTVGKAYIENAYKEDPNADPDVVAAEALKLAAEPYIELPEGRLAISEKAS